MQQVENLRYDGGGVAERRLKTCATGGPGWQYRRLPTCGYEGVGWRNAGWQPALRGGGVAEVPQVANLRLRGGRCDAVAQVGNLGLREAAFSRAG